MYKVGEIIKDGSGVEWVVARLYKWPKWTDYEVIKKSTGEYGSIRVNK